MLSLGGSHRVFLASHPSDFRKAHDGLCALVRDQLGYDPFSGDVFVFWNKAKDRVKLLRWDRNGFWLLYKRLEQGSFPFQPASADARVEIDRAELTMLLEGIEWRQAKRSSRFRGTLAITSRDGSHPRAAR